MPPFPGPKFLLGEKRRCFSYSPIKRHSRNRLFLATYGAPAFEALYQRLRFFFRNSWAKNWRCVGIMGEGQNDPRGGPFKACAAQFLVKAPELRQLSYILCCFSSERCFPGDVLHCTKYQLHRRTGGCICCHVPFSLPGAWKAHGLFDPIAGQRRLRFPSLLLVKVPGMNPSINLKYVVMCVQPPCSLVAPTTRSV